MTNRNLLIGVAALVLVSAGVWLGLQFAPHPTEVAEGDTFADLDHRAGPFRLSVEVEPEAPVVGENRLHLRVGDTRGAPVQGASVRAIAEMPAMGAMPAMRAPVEIRETAPGEYRGPFTLSMGGGWPLTVTIEHPDVGKAVVGFDMVTGRQGLDPSAGLDGTAGGQDGHAMEQPPTGTITVDARRRQLIGLTTAPAERRPFTRELRAVGRVAYDETALTDVSLKYEAWVGDLTADFVGAPVHRGQVLFTVYSPDLYAAQVEYLQALKRAPSSDLLAAARQRLAFWEVDDGFIAELQRRGEPVKYVPIRAPRDGVVVSKNVVEGTAHRAGMALLRIADLSRVWIEAEIYEADLSLVAPGMPVTVTLPYLPGTTLEGTVEFIYPYLHQTSRTARVRLSVPNAEGLLKPDMFADVRLAQPLGERLVVPVAAVIVAGETRVVFEDLGDGRLAPRVVRTGHRSGDWIEITAGLEAGDRVVTSGNFLIASETLLKSGLKQW